MLLIKIYKFTLFVINLTIICGIKTRRQTGYNLDGGYNNNDKRSSTNNNGYRLSLPKNKKALNRVPAYLQDVDYTNNNHRPVPAGTDAIRIVDPPQYFQEQKHRFQKSPSAISNYGDHKPMKNYHGQQQENTNNYYQDQNIYSLNNKYQHKSHKRPQHQALTSLPLRYPIESTYNGPEYLPLAMPAKSQPPSSRPQKYITAHHAIAITHPKPTPTYLGIQTPSSDSLRAQVQRFKEQQKYVFEDEEDEHPVRSKSKSYKRQPIPSTIQQNQSENEYDEGPTRYNSDEKQYNKKPKDSLHTNTYAVVEHTTPSEEHYDTSTFTPYRMLASTRHRKRVTHKPKESTDDNAKERLRTEKKHTVYSEQGFEDSEYDHGDEERHTKRKKKYRQKRNVMSNFEKDEGNEEIYPTMEELPITLNMMNINGEKLTGKALILHITNLIKNATKYLPKDDDSMELDDSESVLLQPIELEHLLKNAGNFTLTMPDHLENEKYLYKHTSLYDTETDPQIRFSEAIQASPYRNFQSCACDDTQPNFEQNDKKKKLGNLGNQLDCIKKQLFGKDPFSDRFFGDNYDPQSPIPTTTTNFRSKLVYDDVMKTIQSALGTEKILSKISGNNFPKKKKKRTTNLFKGDNRNFRNYDNLSEQTLVSVFKKSKKKREKNLDDINSYVFDITKFIPKAYMIRPNGKIYTLNYYPNIEIPVALVNYNYKKENNEPLKIRRRNTGIVIKTNDTVDGYHKKKKLKNVSNKNREILLSSLSKKSPEIVSQKFSHENGMTRYHVNQRYQT